MAELKRRESASAEFEHVDLPDSQGETEQNSGMEANGSTGFVEIEEGQSSSVAPTTLERDEPFTPPESELDTEIQHLQVLLKFLEEEFESVKEKAEALLIKKQITFELLWYFFCEGTEVIFVDGNSGLKCAGKVSTLYFYVLTIDQHGGVYCSQSRNSRIIQFSG